MALRGELLDDPAALEPLLAGWDALAVAERLPYCAPAWQLAWWRHAAPAGARLRVVAVWDGRRLAGVAPFFARRAVPGVWRYGLLASGVSSRVEPLADPGRREAVAGVVAATLAGARPRPDQIDLPEIRADSPWPRLLTAAWPGGSLRTHVDATVPRLTVGLTGADLDEWLAGRSSNFRSQMRKGRRGVVERDGVLRVSRTPEELERDLAAFERLHHARWDFRGGSVSMTEGMDRMLLDAGAAMLPGGRFELASIDVEGRTISSLLFVVAGAEVTYWNGGFDDAYASLRPSLVGLVEAVARGLARGDDQLDLGPGAQDYKRRLADGEALLTSCSLIPSGPRQAGPWLRIVAKRGRLLARELRERRAKAKAQA